MKRLAIWVSLSGLLCVPHAGGDSVTSGFERYQIILDRAPFGRVSEPVEPVSPPTDSEPSFARHLRLTSLFEHGDVIHAGLIDTHTGDSIFLRSDLPHEEFKLIRASLENETVVLEKGSEVATVEMASHSVAVPSATEPRERLVSRERAAMPRRPPWAQRRRAADEMDPGSERTRTRPRPSREEMEARLREYREEVIRQGLPPLPVPIEPDS